MAATLIRFLFMISVVVNSEDTIQSGVSFIAPNIVEGLKISKYTATTLEVLQNSGIIEILEVGGRRCILVVSFKICVQVMK